MTKRWITSLVFAVLVVGNLIQNGASDELLLTWGESGYGSVIRKLVISESVPPCFL